MTALPKPRGNAADRLRAQRISEANTKRWATVKRGPGLARMKAAAKPGECIFCGDALPTSRKPRVMCGAPECLTAYLRCWRRDQRAALREVATAVQRIETLMGGSHE